MDPSRDAPLLIGLAVAFLVAMFVAAAETALLRIPAVRAASFADREGRSHRRLAGLLDELPRVLNAVLLTALLSQIAAATMAGILADRWFGPLGVTIASGVLTVMLFIYAEAIPKTYAVRHPDRVALFVSAPIAALELLLRPLVSALVWIADIQMPGKGVATSPTVTEDELRRLAFRAAREGEITKGDLTMIERAFRLGDRRADDLMVPRADIVAISESESIEAAVAVALETGHKRLPLFRSSVEDIVGVVRLADLVAAEDRGASVGSLAQTPLMIPESKRIFDLLREMQTSGTHLAVIVDEFGGTAGLMTVEDIAEELLGVIDDEPPVQETDTGWSIDASLPVEDLADLMEEELPEGEWNTAAGLLMGILGRVPVIGDEVSVAGHKLRVASTRGRRVTRIEVG